MPLAAVERLFSDLRPTSYRVERLWEMRELGPQCGVRRQLLLVQGPFTEDELDEASSRLTLREFPVEERLAAAAAHPPYSAEL